MANPDSLGADCAPTDSTPDPWSGSPTEPPVASVTTPAPGPVANPEAAALARILGGIHETEAYAGICHGLTVLCVFMWTEWVKRQRGAVADHLANEAPIRATEITIERLDDGLYAVIDREELNDIGAGVPSATPHEALARLLAYLETDGVRS